MVTRLYGATPAAV